MPGRLVSSFRLAIRARKSPACSASVPNPRLASPSTAGRSAPPASGAASIVRTSKLRSFSSALGGGGHFQTLLRRLPPQFREIRASSCRACAPPSAPPATTADNSIAERAAAVASSGRTIKAGGGSRPMRCKTASNEASFPALAGQRPHRRRLARFEHRQPLLHVVELALARLRRRRGGDQLVAQTLLFFAPNAPPIASACRPAGGPGPFAVRSNRAFRADR